MKIKKITGLILATAVMSSCFGVSAADAEVITLEQVSENGVEIEIEATADAGYVVEVFAPSVDDAEEWVPGADSESNSKELVYIEQGTADSDGVISISFNLDGESGEYTLRFSVNGEISDVETFEFDKDFGEDDSEGSDENGGNSGSTGSNRPSGGSGGGSGGGGQKTLATVIKDTEEKQEILFDVYSDLDEALWARNAIVNLTNRGILRGRSADKFEPNANVTREEFVKMLVEAFVSDEIVGKPVSFEDVIPTRWYYPYILKGVEAGIVTGYSETVFGIGEFITRQDMAVMAYRAAMKNYISENETDVFADEDKISDYAKEAVAVMAENGIINGKGDGNFCPLDTATRAEAAKIIYEIMELLF